MWVHESSDLDDNSDADMISIMTNDLSRIDSHTCDFSVSLTDYPSITETFSIEVDIVSCVLTSYVLNSPLAD
jgi:hypothetical protein